MSAGTKPKARDGLLTSDHSKRGRRFLIVCDPETHRVVLLEPWEHAVLVLCDGTREPGQIAELLEQGVDGEGIERRQVERCLRILERERLIDGAGLDRAAAERAPGPRTLAGLQQAYREWHKDPEKTGRILAGVLPPPFLDPGPAVRAGLDPTVALPEEADEPRPVGIGSMLVLAGSESLLDAPATGKRAGRGREAEPATLIGKLDESPVMPPVEAAGVHILTPSAPEGSEDLDVDQDVAELLLAVDLDFEEAESREAEASSSRARVPPPPVGRAFGGEARIPESKDRPRPSAKVLTSVAADPALAGGLTRSGARAIEKPPSHRSVPLSEAALFPTMVGLPPTAGTADAAPILVAPARSDTPSGDFARADTTEEAAGDAGRPARPRYGGDGEEEQTTRLETSRARARTDAPEPRAGPRLASDLVIGAVLQDLSGVDGPTDSIRPRSPIARTDSARAKRPVRRPKAAAPARRGIAREEDRAGGAATDLTPPPRAREVIERVLAVLQAGAGLRDTKRGARGDAERQRRDAARARELAAVLGELGGLELELLLGHLQRLREKVPESKRVVAVIAAVERVRGREDDSSVSTGDLDESPPDPRALLVDFERVLSDALEHGRCPACLSVIAPHAEDCASCGFTRG